MDTRDDGFITYFVVAVLFLVRLQLREAFVDPEPKIRYNYVFYIVFFFFNFSSHHKTRNYQKENPQDLV